MLKKYMSALTQNDALTGVLNRSAFTEKLKQEIRIAGRGKAALAFIVTDIDYFKKINDHYGYQIGDLVLQRFAEQLNGFSRKYDFVGRYGGGQFVVCFPGVNGSQAESIAERMRKKVADMEITFPDGAGTVRFTASFGVASLRLKSKDNAAALTKRADDALFKAKRAGRNQVCREQQNGSSR
jgi:diguanylate cyclase (GGDEF)-like protein